MRCHHGDQHLRGGGFLRRYRLSGALRAPQWHRAAAEATAVRTFNLSRAVQPAYGAGARLKTAQHGCDMTVICPKCRAATDLGSNGGDSDARYKLECPVLRERRIAEGSDIKIECLYMRRARDSAILKLRRGRKARRVGVAP
jgi:hypothetical protein